MARLGIVAESPLSFDGENYLHAEGEGYYLDRLAQHFEEIVIFAHILLPGSPHYEETATYAFRAPNIRVVELPHKGQNKYHLFQKFKQLISNFTLLFKRRKEVEAFYIFIPGYSGALASLICLIMRVPYLLYLASDWPEEAELLIPIRGRMRKLFVPLYRGLVSWLQNSAVRGACTVFVHGFALMEKYRTAKAPVVETIPRLNWPAYKLFDRTNSCIKGPVRLLFVGYLIERKGARYFVEAIKVLRDQSRDVRGVIIGSGEEERSLQELITQYALEDHIELKGHMPNGEPLIAEYRKADIFICPTFSGEGFPRVLYEAMSQSLPIVCSDVCGISLKLQPDQNALFVPPKDPQAIADRVVSLIDKPELHRRLIENGTAFMSRLLEDTDGGKQVARYFSETIALKEMKKNHINSWR